MNWLERHTKWQNNEGICSLVDPYQHTHREGEEGETEIVRSQDIRGAKEIDKKDRQIDKAMLISRPI